MLWGGWLVLLAVTFSVATTINPYYTAALTPAVAAILGAGVAAAWSRDRSAAGRAGGPGRRARRDDRPTPRGSWRDGQAPGWLVLAVIAVGVAAVAVVLVSMAVRADAVFAAALAAALVAVAVVARRGLGRSGAAPPGCV